MVYVFSRTPGMLSALAKTIGQLDDPAFRRVAFIGFFAATGVIVALWLGIRYLLSITTLFGIGWLESAADMMGGFGAIIFTWFLFPGVISAVISLMLDDVAVAVEAEHYPDLPAATPPRLSETLLSTGRFFIVFLAVNLGVVFFMLIPPLFPFVFYGANGYLIGREYFEMVAMRRISPTLARNLMKAHRGRIFVVGAAIAFLLTVPVINLLAPIAATAIMVHMFESWRTEISNDLSRQGGGLRTGYTGDTRE